MADQHPQAFTHPRFEKRWESLGYEGLLPEERQYLAVWWLVSEVSNGTFDQYFFNGSGDMAHDAYSGLRAMGLTEAAELLQHAMSFLSRPSYPIDTVERRGRLLEVSQNGDAFNEIDDNWFEIEQDYLGIAAEWLRRIYDSQGVP